MKKIYALFLSIFTLVISSHSVLAMTDSDAKSYVQKVAGALELILNEPKNKELVYKDFENLFSTYGDVPIITRYLIGPPSREMSSKQMKKAEYEIKKYLARKYGQQFEDYIGAKVEINSIRQFKNNFDVKTEFKSPNQEFTVSWIVSDKSGEIKLVDIVIEGISMLRMEREEIGSRLEKSRFNVDKLLETLNQ